jgi:DNA polymerase III subunit delta
MNPPEFVSPASKVPQVSILHGDDDFAMEQEVKRIQAALGLAVSASDSSIQAFEGRPFSDPQVQRAALTPDLFSPKRLVILKDPVFPRTKKKKTSDSVEPEDIEGKDKLVSEKFIHMLEELDEKTYFIIAVADEFKGGKEKGKWVELGPGYWLTRWAQKSKGKAEISAFKLPDMKEINVWIQAEAVRQVGKINPAAAAELTFHFGNDTRILSQEITKLLIYVDRKRPVEAGDVKDLCNYGGEGNIFNMIDSLANGDARTAMVQYHLLLQEGDPVSIFSMIVRQFRQLILTQEMVAEQKSEGDIAIEFRIPDFAARKLMQQTRRFSSSQFAGIYHRLLEIDAASKTNAGMPLDVAIDAFIQELAHR